ncbi:hypothetical protein ACFLYU_05795, partial [Candidatus Dependentiae bacterium]
MKKSYFYKIFIVFILALFFTPVIFSVKLIFVNKYDNPLYVKLVGWKRWRGLLYKQEKARRVDPGASLIWVPYWSARIKSHVLDISDGKKLKDRIVLKRKKGYAVTKGRHRMIRYEYKGLYQDIIEKKERALEKIFRIGADLLEKTREEVFKIFNIAFGPLRALIRYVKSYINPEPYNIIHKNPYAKKDAKVRIGGPIACKGEKDVFDRRQKKARRAQEKFLGIKFGKNEKPLVVSFVASGGGQRAVLCTIGSVLGAKKIGLFNCGVYMSTLSASTWFLAPWLISGLSLEAYKKRAIAEARSNLGLKDVAVDSKYALDLLKTKFAFGQPIGVIDLFGILLSIYYLKGYGENGNPQRCYLSSLQNYMEMKSGDMIIPIFTAVTAEVGMEHKWCWFTPWEFGSRWFGSGGMYIPVWAFGRRFIKQKRTKNWGSVSKPLYPPRTSLGFVMGVCGSAPAATLGQTYDQVIDKMKSSPIKAVLKYALKKTDLKKVRFVWADVLSFMFKWPESLFSKYKFLKIVDA